MDSTDNNQQTAIQQNNTQITGLYRISDIDKFNIARIDGIKTNFLMSFTALSPNSAQTQLSDILSNMQEVIQKYFSDVDIRKHTVKIGNEDIDFFTLKEYAKMNLQSKDLIRTIAENAFNIYNHFTKIIGVAIPTSKKNVKKKLISRLFSLIPNKNKAFYDNMMLGYKNFLKLDYRYKNSLGNLAFYCISEMPKYDLNCNILMVGSARIGKSTHFLHGARRIYSARWKKSLDEVDLELINNGWVFDKIIYSKEQGLEPIMKSKESVIGVDELYFVADRRNSMNTKQVEYTGKINAYASNNNTIFNLIQNLSDVDTRVYSSTNVLYLEYERGRALLYIKSKNFPIIKDTYEFEKFAKNPELLGDMNTALDHLKRIPSYIGEVRYSNMEGNVLYNTYKTRKDKFQKDEAG